MTGYCFINSLVKTVKPGDCHQLVMHSIQIISRLPKSATVCGVLFN